MADSVIVATNGVLRLPLASAIVVPHNPTSPDAGTYVPSSTLSDSEKYFLSATGVSFTNPGALERGVA